MLTPLDIQNKKFKKSFRGYNKEDVDSFLLQILKNYEENYKENIELKDKVDILTNQITKYNDLEDTLKETLVFAQKTADDIISSARKEAELEIEKAEISVKEDIWKAEVQVESILREYEKLKKESKNFKNKYKIFLMSQLDMLETFNINSNDKDIQSDSNIYNEENKNG